MFQQQHGFDSSIMAHIMFRGDGNAWSIFRPPQSLPRLLAHILNAAATPDAFWEFDSPGPIDEPIPRLSIIVVDGLLHQEGLLPW